MRYALVRMKPLLVNAATMNRIQGQLHQLLTPEGAPALSAEQVQKLLDLVRQEAGLPPYPWIEDVS